MLHPCQHHGHQCIGCTHQALEVRTTTITHTEARFTDISCGGCCHCSCQGTHMCCPGQPLNLTQGQPLFGATGAPNGLSMGYMPSPAPVQIHTAQPAMYGRPLLSAHMVPQPVFVHPLPRPVLPPPVFVGPPPPPPLPSPTGYFALSQAPNPSPYGAWAQQAPTITHRRSFVPVNEERTPPVVRRSASAPNIVPLRARPLPQRPQNSSPHRRQSQPAQRAYKQGRADEGTEIIPLVDGATGLVSYLQPVSPSPISSISVQSVVEVQTDELGTDPEPETRLPGEDSPRVPEGRPPQSSPAYGDSLPSPSRTSSGSGINGSLSPLPRCSSSPVQVQTDSIELERRVEFKNFEKKAIDPRFADVIKRARSVLESPPKTRELEIEVTSFRQTRSSSSHRTVYSEAAATQRHTHLQRMSPTGSSSDSASALEALPSRNNTPSPHTRPTVFGSVHSPRCSSTSSHGSPTFAKLYSAQGFEVAGATTVESTTEGTYSRRKAKSISPATSQGVNRVRHSSHTSRVTAAAGMRNTAKATVPAKLEAAARPTKQKVEGRSTPKAGVRVARPSTELISPRAVVAVHVAPAPATIPPPPSPSRESVASSLSVSSLSMSAMSGLSDTPGNSPCRPLPQTRVLISVPTNAGTFSPQMSPSISPLQPTLLLNHLMSSSSSAPSSTRSPVSSDGATPSAAVAMALRQVGSPVAPPATALRHLQARAGFNRFSSPSEAPQASSSAELSISLTTSTSTPELSAVSPPNCTSSHVHSPPVAGSSVAETSDVQLDFIARAVSCDALNETPPLYCSAFSTGEGEAASSETTITALKRAEFSYSNQTTLRDATGENESTFYSSSGYSSVTGSSLHASSWMERLREMREELAHVNPDKPEAAGAAAAVANDNRVR
eukprot:TRINITY_DN14585_c0_g1_i1.p1 TRINITY_DN14585_c0_g1~~TRINITY_DN14585_c0_g1_i1.p1  ORF type:complete len:892 (-),score=75.62 TRINITY_DN14585_c0_g1_i1:78-2753(-)